MVYYYIQVLFDLGSIKIFCFEVLIEKFGVKGQWVNFFLIIVNSRENVDVEVVVLEVVVVKSGMGKISVIQLLKVYVLFNLFILESCIVLVSDVIKWFYFKDFCFF